MNKNLRIVMAGLLINTAIVGLTFAQKDNVGIGTTKPDQSAILDLNSNSKGLLVPRCSLEQRNGIQSPATGLLVFQTDFLSGFYFYDGKDWKPLTSAEANSVAAGGNWSNTSFGDALVGGEVLGSNNDFPLKLVVNSLPSGYIGSDNGAQLQRTFMGYEAGRYNTGTANIGFGARALKGVSGNSGGDFNLGLGTNVLAANLSGSNNMGIGTNTLYTLTSGNRNSAIGTNALFSTNGSDNTAIGGDALSGTTGSGNVAIGSGAGTGASVGSSNVFIGAFAGAGSTSSQKLYIANTNTTQPLVYGDFNVNFMSIGNNITPAKRDAIATTGIYGLLVEKGILTEKLKVATLSTAEWSDYVFEPSYKMLSLDQVEKFVKLNKHLPNVPTTEEMMSNGNDVMKTDAKLLEKIEELTLYMIEMNKELKALKQENQQMKKQIEKK